MRSCFKIGHDLRQIEGLRRSTVGARAESQMTRRSLVRESSSSTRSIGRHRVAGSLPPRNPSRTASRQLPTFFSLSQKREKNALVGKETRASFRSWLARSGLFWRRNDDRTQAVEAPRRDALSKAAHSAAGIATCGSELFIATVDLTRRNLERERSRRVRVPARGDANARLGGDGVDRRGPVGYVTTRGSLYCSWLVFPHCPGHRPINTFES